MDKVGEIDKNNIADIIALTPMQEAMLTYYLRDPGSDLYFEILCLEMSGYIDRKIFEKAWDFVVSSNEMLRTVFRWEGLVSPIQVILKKHRPELRYCLLQFGDSIEQKKSIEAMKMEVKRDKFDLRQVAFRVVLGRTGKDKHVMIISHHHILFDGWSMGIILREFLRAYNALVVGRNPEIPEKGKYKEFVKWILEQKDKPDKPGKYWQEYFDGFAVRIDPIEGKEEKKNIKNAADYSISFPPNITDELNRFIKTKKITLASFLYSAWGILLQAANSCSGVVFDITVSGRSAKIAAVENTVGLFINTLPFRVDTQPHDTLREVVRRTYNRLQDLAEYAAAFRGSAAGYSVDYQKNLLFNSLVVVENYPVETGVMSKSQILSFDSFSISGSANYDLTLIITSFDNIRGSISYNKDIFTEEIVEALSHRFLHIIRLLIERSSDRVPGIQIVPEEERNKILKHLNRSQKARTVISSGHTAPRNSTEKRIAGLWCEVLHRDNINIDIDVNFFESGGHSLKAGELITRIQKSFDVRIPFIEIINRPTIRAVSKYIKEAAKQQYQPVKSSEKKEYYPLSSPQERMYMIQRMEAGSTAYNIASVFMLEGKPDKIRFGEAFDDMIKRHEALRTSFQLSDGTPVQIIHPWGGETVEHHETADAELDQIVQNNIKPFDLSEAPLFRIKLFRIAAEKHMLIFDMHHIIFDGVSMGIFVKELAAFYSKSQLPALRNQYKDFAVWQKNRLESGRLEEQKKYWQQHFSGELPILDLPTDFKRPAFQSFKGEKITHQFEEKLVRDVRSLLKKTGSTLYTALLSVYSILLYKYTGQQDVIIGSPAAGRNHADFEPLVGLFLDGFAIRSRLHDDYTFELFLNETGKKTVAAYDNQEYPLKGVIKDTVKDSDLSRNPLFDVMLIVQNYDKPKLEFAGLKFLPYPFDRGVARVDLTLEVTEIGGDMAVDFEYCTDLFKGQTVEQLNRHFSRVLKQVCANPSIRLCDIELLSHQERESLVFDFNKKNRTYPSGGTVLELFEEQVKKRPGKIAVISGNEYISYHQLDKDADQITDYLLKKIDICPGEPVGLLMEGSGAMLTAIVGVFKSGAPYVPLDPTLPEKRIETIIRDAGIAVVISKEKEYNYQPGSKALPGYSTGEISPRAKPGHIAYIIYTSGSTGKPKGIPIRHANLFPLICWARDFFQLDENIRVLQNLSFNFDFNVFEVFSTICFGGTLFFLNRETVRDMVEYVDFINGNGIDTIHTTPSFFNTLIQTNKKMITLKILHLGGEKLAKDYISSVCKLVPETCIIYNGYGPTETTVNSSIFPVLADGVSHLEHANSIPIGKPSANNKIFVLDKNYQVQPVGIPGELCIAGDGLAPGYLNDPEKTEEKFIHIRTLPEGKIYRSGDLARWLPGGDIAFLGRIDSQVKIRGFRIEIGEIESLLLKYENITDAVVVTGGSKENTYLIAYFAIGSTTGKGSSGVADPGGFQFDAAILKEYLSRQLPHYMVPAVFVRLDKIPLNLNGKIDIKGLPDPGVSKKTGYVAPANDLEKKQVELWSQVLGTKKDTIGITDDFFDLGGHSLTANLLISKIHREFNVKIPLGKIFREPTISSLSKYIKNAIKERYYSIAAREKREYYPLSSAQKRVFFMQQIDLYSTGYNLTSLLTLHGELERNRVEEAFKILVSRHESLRTCFAIIGHKPVQLIADEVPFKLEYTPVDKEGLNLCLDKFIRPFDLAGAPLMRAGLMGVGDSRFVLILDMHHIISDGTSLAILIEECMTHYKGGSLPELRLQYKDYTLWQKEQKGEPFIKDMEDFWLQQFKGNLPVLDLTTDYPRPAIKSFNGDTLYFELDKTTTARLKDLAEREKITLFVLLLAIFYVLLARLSGEEDIIIGTPAAGREHTDLLPILGMFVNTLALRNFPGKEKSFTAFLAEVKSRTLQAFENRDYQFEDLVMKVAGKRDKSRNPLFDVMFVWQNIRFEAIDIGGLNAETLNFENKTAKFDLLLDIKEIGNSLSMQWEYCTTLFMKETIEEYLKYFIKICNIVSTGPGIFIKDIGLVEKEEEERFLSEIKKVEEEVKVEFSL